MAIDLCNKDKYYSNSNLTNAADRKPRATEDIEIIGLINTNETLDMSSCSDLSTISSMTLNFNSYNKTFTINADEPGGLSSDNIREPDQDARDEIQRENPLRYEHGWYTISSQYTMKHLGTNGKLKLSNIGYNNNLCTAYHMELTNSCYANGTIDADTVTIGNNSRMYGTTLACNDLNITSAKIDSMSIGNEKCIVTSASLADLDLTTSSIESTSTKYIGGTMYFTQGRFTSDTIACEINDTSTASLPTRITAFTHPITFTSCTFDKNSVATLSECRGAGNTWEGEATIDTLYDGPQTITSGSLAIRTLDTATSNNFISNTGTLSIASGSGLTTITITSNGGSTSIGSEDNGYQVQIQNLGKAVAQFYNSGNLTSSVNDGTITANIIKCENLTNNQSGTIISSQCIVTNGSNDGFMNHVSGTSFANNPSGSIDVAIMMAGSSNQGKIQDGTFRESSSNDGSGLVQSAMFHDSASNNGRVVAGKFYNSSINTLSGTSCEFYDNSENQGYCIDGIFKDTSKNTSINLNVSSFYNSSQNTALITGVADFFEGSACLSNFGSGIKATFNDFSSATGTSLSSGSIDFKDDSRCDTITFTSGSLSFHDRAEALNVDISDTGLPYVTFHDKSTVETIQGIGPAILMDNAISKGNLQNSGTVFRGSASQSGMLLATMTYVTFQDQSYHTGLGASSVTEVFFLGGSRNQAPINGGPSLYFDQGATNLNRIIGVTSVSFSGGSVNASGGHIEGVTNLIFDSSISKHKYINATNIISTSSDLYPLYATGIEESRMNCSTATITNGSFNAYKISASNITFSGSTNGVSDSSPYSWSIGDLSASNVKFHQGSTNYGKASASNIEFSGSVNSAEINGSTKFINSSNQGIVRGAIIFNNSSNDNGFVGNVTGSGSVNNSIISGDCTFTECTNGGTIAGDCTFNQSSINNSIISGAVSFTNNSINNGTIYGSATFDGTSTNNGQIISP